MSYIRRYNGDIYFYDIDSSSIHREKGPAIIRLEGGLEWYHKGFHHRKDGPALIFHDGCREWFLYGNRHCESGPAVRYIGRIFFNFWFLDGDKYPQKDWLNKILKDKVK